MEKNLKFNEFLRIAKGLNEIGVIPLLMGSVGLEVVTGTDWGTEDLDIHIPGDERGWEAPAETAIHDWDRVAALMLSLEYRLVDLHEHEFSNGDYSVEFGIIDTLPSFAGVLLTDLQMHQTGDIRYYLLTPLQYMRVYEASSMDSYRADKNNEKDFKKIAYLKNVT
ncbi:MAG: phosphoribosylanthranilate isomerase [Bacillus sp. (in: firmicutes)]